MSAHAGGCYSHYNILLCTSTCLRMYVHTASEVTTCRWNTTVESLPTTALTVSMITTDRKKALSPPSSTKSRPFTPIKVFISVGDAENENGVGDDAEHKFEVTAVFMGLRLTRIECAQKHPSCLNASRTQGFQVYVQARQDYHLPCTTIHSLHHTSGRLQHVVAVATARGCRYKTFLIERCTMNLSQLHSLHVRCVPFASCVKGVIQQLAARTT